MTRPHILTVSFPILVALAAIHACVVFGEGSTVIEQIADAQRRFRAPYNMIAVRWLPQDFRSEPYLMARSQNSPYGMPTSVPMINIGAADSSPSLFIRQGANRLIREYEAGRHRLPSELARRMRAYIDGAFDERDFRSVWYEMYSPHAFGDSDRTAATIHLYDATSSAGGVDRVAPIENWLQWTFPERAAGLHALIELLFAFQNYDPEVAPLDAFRNLLREAATYVDLFYVSKGIPTTIRLLTTKSRSKVFGNRQTYGFNVDTSAPPSGDGLVVMKIAGAEFVRRFGSHWPVWQRAYELERSPPNPLFEFAPLAHALNSRLGRSAVEYECTTDILRRGGSVGQGAHVPPITSLEQFPTLNSFLDGKFNGMMDRIETPLLF